MPQPSVDNNLTGQGASAIYQAFGIYRSRFKEITRRAPLRFKNRDWHGVQTDAVLRLDLYKDAVDRIEIDIRRLLADHLQEKKIWAFIKAAYSDLLIIYPYARSCRLNRKRRFDSDENRS